MCAKDATSSHGLAHSMMSLTIAILAGSSQPRGTHSLAKLVFQDQELAVKPQQLKEPQQPKQVDAVNVSPLPQQETHHSTNGQDWEHSTCMICHLMEGQCTNRMMEMVTTFTT